MSQPNRGLAFELARVTIELTSPLTIGSGRPSDLTDVICATDPNGLPAIPGWSIAGVMRHLLANGADPETDAICRQTFGYQDRDLGSASSVEVSWGQLHGGTDMPVSMLGKPVGDPVVAFLAAGITRDHVRLNGHGVVGRAGKYDVSSVPVGARFTFELIIDREARIGAAALVALLRSPAARFGGK